MTTPAPTGFFAGWIDLLGIEAGVEVNFDGQVSFIGSSAINGILSNAPQQTYYPHVMTITVPASGPMPAGASPFNFAAQWVTNGGQDYYLTVQPPPNYLPITDHNWSDQLRLR